MAGKVIKQYNKLGKAFLDYEVAYYKMWCNAIRGAENMLRCSLLVAVGTVGQLAVNWDAQVCLFQPYVRCVSLLCKCSCMLNSFVA